MTRQCFHWVTQVMLEHFLTTGTSESVFDTKNQNVKECCQFTSRYTLKSLLIFTKVLRFSSSSFNVVVQISLFMPPKFKYLQKAKTAMNNTNYQLALMSDYHTILMLYTMLQK